MGSDTPADRAQHNGAQVLPGGYAIQQKASKEETSQYYFPVPWREDQSGFFATHAPNVERAKQSMADEYRGVSAEELPEPSLNRHEAIERDGGKWPELHERDVWRLTRDQRPSAIRRYRQNHDRPTKTTISRVLSHWDDVEEIPFGNVEALQAAHGIGPKRAACFAGAAAAERLVDHVKEVR